MAVALLARCRGCRPPAPKIVPAHGREGSREVLPACPLSRGKNRRGIEIRREVGTRNREKQRGKTWIDEREAATSHRRILGRRQLCTSPSVHPSSRRRLCASASASLPTDGTSASQLLLGVSLRDASDPAASACLPVGPRVCISLRPPALLIAAQDQAKLLSDEVRLSLSLFVWLHIKQSS